MEKCPQNHFTTSLKGELLELDGHLGDLLKKSQNENFCLDELEQILDRVCHVAKTPIFFHEYGKDWDEEGEGLLRAVQEKAVKSFSLIEHRTERNIFEDPHGLDCYAQDLKQSIIDQTEGLEINSNSRVLFIGCGAQPFSCFAMKDHFGCQVSGIDSDPQAIEKAKRQSWLSDISLHAATGEDFLVKGFSHIFIASLVPNKEQIIHRLHETVDDGCKIIVRFGSGLQRLANYPFKVEHPEKWEVICYFGDEGSLYQSIGLVKK